MNRTVPPRDRGNRVVDSIWASRSPRALPGAIGLVGGTEDHPSTCENAVTLTNISRL
jgi:hypothetical protein